MRNIASLSPTLGYSPCVYPIFNIYLPGESRGLCAEVSNLLHRKERNLCAKASNLIINLRTEPREASLHTQMRLVQHW